jgi:hypothetical protein
VARYALQLVDRPGSVIVVWTLDSTLGRIRELTRYTVPRRPPALGRSTIAARIAEDMRGRYADSLSGGLRVTRLVEGIGKALRAARLETRGGDFEIELFVPTDGREEGTPFGSFECGKLPEPKAFITRVINGGLLTPQVEGPSVRVVFGYMDLAPIDKDRCKLEGASAMQVEALWWQLFKHLQVEFQVFARDGDPDLNAVGGSTNETTNIERRAR